MAMTRRYARAAPGERVFEQVPGDHKGNLSTIGAIGLTGLQVVEMFCARFRQEDGYRDLKQRLGWEECRAWTKNPILRTTQALFVTMTALRLLQFQLEQEEGSDWWLHSPWNKGKVRPSVLDVERLLRQHRQEIQHRLAAWLETEEKTGNAEPHKVAM